MQKVLFLIIFTAASFYLQAQNLLGNPGFEDTTLAPWQVFGGGNPLEVQSDTVHSGSKALKVSDRTIYYQGVTQSVYNIIQPNVFYEFSAWVNSVTIPAATNYFTINLKMVPVSGAIQYIQVALLRDYKTGWMKLRGFYKLTNPVSNYTDIQVYITGPATTSVDFYVDDVAMTAPATYTPPPFDADAFVKASGRELVTGTTPLLLRGINFSDYSDGYPYSSGENSYNQIYNTYQFDWSDYAYMHDLGVNTVRLNMDFRAFEDDTNPYNYKAEGWHWLEKNILAARENDMYLILDMHTPQGGYQSYGFNGAFWQNTTAAINNRNRFIALWKAIADRYKEEPAIAGFDLINEPLLPAEAGQSTSTLYSNFMNLVIDSIRTVDTNHLIVVEQPFKNNGTYDHALLDDNNIMYDSHFYIPWDYCSQLDPNYGGNDYGPYPNATYGWNKSQLITDMLTEGLQFSLTHQVPLNTGEFGITRMVAQEPGYGATTYLADMQCIFDSLRINAQWFNFHLYSASFGLFYNAYGFPDQTYKVTAFEDFLDGFIPVYPGGTVTGGDTIFAGEQSGTLVLTGYDGNILQWQSSVAPFTDWTAIPHTGDTYQPGILTQTTKFRAWVTGTCINTGAVPTTVTVLPSGCNLELVITGQDNPCPDGIQLYSVTEIPDATYLWSVSGGVIVSGQNTSTVGIQWSNGVVGTVSVEVTQ